MWSRWSAIERCPSPRNWICKCPTVTDNGLVKGTDILLKQILCSEIGKSLNIIALHWPVICYCWAFMYSVSRQRASLDRRSTTPHVFITGTNHIKMSNLEYFDISNINIQLRGLIINRKIIIANLWNSYVY